MKAALKALTQFLSDPRLWLVLAGCAVLTLLVLSGLWWGVRYGVAWVAETWPSRAGWLSYGQGTLGFIVALLLLPTTFVLIASFFQERVADIVEARHYPDLPPANSTPLISSVAASVRLMVFMILLNVVALPFYIALTWFFGAGAFLMLAVNGLITGREYFEIAALRRMGRLEMRALRRRHRLRIFLAGTAIAGLILVPVVNLAAPVLGIAFMTHIFHDCLSSPAAAE